MNEATTKLAGEIDQIPMPMQLAREIDQLVKNARYNLNLKDDDFTDCILGAVNVHIRECVRIMRQNELRAEISEFTPREDAGMICHILSRAFQRGVASATANQTKSAYMAAEYSEAEKRG